MCEHIRVYYKNVAKEPPIFWEFDSDIIPQEANIKQKKSRSGDKCHHNIINLSDSKARRIFSQNCRHENINICLNKKQIQFEERILLEQVSKHRTV